MLKKYYNIIFLIILCIMIVPSNAINCTPCPSQTPYIVYVTVTVPVPVMITPAPTLTPIQTPTRQILTPTPIPETGITTKLTSNPEYIIGGLFILLAIGVIYIKLRKNKKKSTSKPKITQDITELYEETKDEEVEVKEIEMKKEPDKPKKPKKPKSLLDQDFEF